MNRASYIRLQERYGGRFIAQRDGKVVAHGVTYRSLIKSLGKKRLKREGLVFSYIHPKHAVLSLPVLLQKDGNILVSLALC